MILRKLTALEAGFDKKQKNGDYILVNGFLVESKIDFFENKSVIERALHNWKQLHPLLRSRIINDEDTSNLNFYFSYLPEEKLKRNDNVIFLQCESLDNDLNDCWTDIFEKELHTSFDSFNNYLWRLKFIKLYSDSSNCVTYKYCIIFSIDHAITDRRNAYSIILELLEIIEALYSDLPLNVNENRNAESKLEFQYPNDPRFVTIDDNDKNIEEFKAEIERPIWNISDRLTKNNLKLRKYYTIDGTEHINDQNMKHSYTTGFKIFSLDDRLLEKLLGKCRSHGAKLTKFLDLVITVALRRIFKKYAINYESFKYIQSFVSINLRPHLDPPMENYVMGYWATGISQSYEKDLDLYEGSKWFEEFWDIVKTSSADLHEFIKSKKYFETQRLKQITKFFLDYLSSDVKEIPELFYDHYLLTNLCTMPVCSKNSKEFVKIKEYYMGSSFSIHNDFEFASNLICTLNNRLFWSITFNKTVFPDKIVELWIEYINEILLKFAK